MLNLPYRKVLTLCPPENASYRRKDDGYSVNTEVHGGSRAIAVRKEKGASGAEAVGPDGR